MRFRKFLKPYKTRGSSFREHTISEGGVANSSRYRYSSFICFILRYETVSYSSSLRMAYPPKNICHGLPWLFICTPPIPAHCMESCMARPAQ